MREEAAKVSSQSKKRTTAKCLTDDFPAPVLPHIPIFSLGFWSNSSQRAFVGKLEE
jgi:hypothetical protein